MKMIRRRDLPADAPELACTECKAPIKNGFEFGNALVCIHCVHRAFKDLSRI